MQREPAAFLWDVHESALRIREFVVGHDFEAFSASVLLQSAIERQFEIIGEALIQLSKVAPDIASKIPYCGQIGTGRGIDDLLAEYPYLEREDMQQALRYAARRT